MLQAVKGIYRDGHVHLLDKPEGIESAEVVVTFMIDRPVPTDPSSTPPRRRPKFGEFAKPGVPDTPWEDFVEARKSGEPREGREEP